MNEGVHKSLRPRRRKQKNVMLEKPRGMNFKDEVVQLFLHPSVWMAMDSPDLYVGMERALVAQASDV